MTDYKYKDTTVILYPPGGYGSFLHWLLEYLSGNFPSGSRPFNPNGNAHRFHGILFDCKSTPPGIDRYLAGDTEYQFGRTHAFFSNDSDLSKHFSFVKTYGKYVKKIVRLTSQPDIYLLIKHNQLSKMPSGNYDQYVTEVVNQYREQFNAGSIIPDWQLREMLSFRHRGDISIATNLFQPEDSENVINVCVTDLVYKFQPTIKKLFADLELQMLRADELEQIESEWLALQKFTTVDRLCHNIVNAVLTNQPLSWDQSQLTIFDEAFIQYLLRENRLEMRCFGLDIFPTDSVNLKELLYPV